MRRELLFTSVLCILAFCSALAGADESVPAMIASGRVDEALSALHGQISHAPNDAAAHNLLCRAYFTLGDWDHGIAACEKAVSLAPENSQYHLWLAEFYLEAPGIVGGGRDKAVHQAESLLTLDPARAHWVNARLAEKKHDFAAAEDEYKKAIDASHSGAAAWLNLGLFYRHRERWDDMEQALLHVRSAPLDRPDALVDAAEILLHAQRNLPEVAQLLRAYLSSDSKVEQAPAFKAHYLLGSAVEKLGDKQAAAVEYRSALALAHEFHPAQEALQRVSR